MVKDLSTMQIAGNGYFCDIQHFRITRIMIDNISGHHIRCEGFHINFGISILNIL